MQPLFWVTETTHWGFSQFPQRVSLVHFLKTLCVLCLEGSVGTRKALAGLRGRFSVSLRSQGLTPRGWLRLSGLSREAALHQAFPACLLGLKCLLCRIRLRPVSITRSWHQLPVSQPLQICQQLDLKNKISKHAEQKQNCRHREHFDGCQMGRGLRGGWKRWRD